MSSNIFELLGKDELVINVRRESDEKWIGRVINYIEVEGIQIVQETYGSQAIGIDCLIIERLQSMPRLTLESYKSFLSKSEFHNYFISFDDLAKHNIKIVDNPTALDEHGVIAESYGIQYDTKDDVDLSVYRFLLSYKELDNGMVHIRGVTHDKQ